jgi:hypothetical protein
MTKKVRIKPNNPHEIAMTCVHRFSTLIRQAPGPTPKTKEKPLSPEEKRLMMAS